MSAENDRTVGDLLATFVQAADPSLAADLRNAAGSDGAENRAGCCDCCNGVGADMSCEGDCIDCLGTGCAHPDPCAKDGAR